jgi:hypothetical protein
MAFKRRRFGESFCRFATLRDGLRRKKFFIVRFYRMTSQPLLAVLAPV